MRKMNLVILALIFFGIIASAAAEDLSGESTLTEGLVLGSGNEKFYEPFDSNATIEGNNGTMYMISFEPGIKENASRGTVTYPTPMNMSFGTIEFFFKFPSTSGYSGLFDIGLLYGTNPNSMGLFLGSTSRQNFIMEVRNKNKNMYQAWSQSGEFGTDNKWHHVIVKWNCTGSGKMQVIADGVAGSEAYCLNFYPNATTISVGYNYYYGASGSYIDEFRIYDHLIDTTNISQKYTPVITSATPGEDMLNMQPGETEDFSITATNPSGHNMNISWYLNGVKVYDGNSLHYTMPDKKRDVVRVVVSVGPYTAIREWLVMSSDSGIYTYNDSVYIDGEKFLIKGISYTGWLNGTGPIFGSHKGFPGEFDNVTQLVNKSWVVNVPDLNNDREIQMWEVVEYDFKTMRDTGANTIRTYSSGSWHDKNRDGDVDISATNETINEVNQGDIPDWVYDRMIAFCEQNDMKIIIGYWVAEEDWKGSSKYCNWDDLEIAEETFGRIVEKYSDSPAVLGWGIGNEVHLPENQNYFTWGVNINEYLNRLYAYVREVDPNGKPIMYAKYHDEPANFLTLTADIIGPQAYTFSAKDMLDQFIIPAPAGKAYIMAEFGHLTNHIEEHWNLSKQHAGGSFLEYNDVWWKSSDQQNMGIVTKERARSTTRFNKVFDIYGGHESVICNANTSCTTYIYGGNSTYKYCRDLGDGYDWYTTTEITGNCNDLADVGNRETCSGKQQICGDDLKAYVCSFGSYQYAPKVQGVTYECASMGEGWKWYTHNQFLAGCDKLGKVAQHSYYIGYICSDGYVWDECNWTTTCREKTFDGIIYTCQDNPNDYDYNWYKKQDFDALCTTPGVYVNCQRPIWRRNMCADDYTWQLCGETTSCSANINISGVKNFCAGNYDYNSYWWVPETTLKNCTQGSEYTCDAKAFLCNKQSQYAECSAATSCETKVNISFSVYSNDTFICRNYGTGNQWTTNEGYATYCDSTAENGNMSSCGGREFVCMNKTWLECGVNATCCQSDAQCDDGIFCNGQEICNMTSKVCQGRKQMNCTANNLAQIATCVNNPDNNSRTWDYLAGFTSVCDESKRACTTASLSLTHTCDKSRCNATCLTDAECDDGYALTTDKCSGCVCTHTNSAPACDAYVSCSSAYNSSGTTRWCRDFGTGYKWYTATEAAQYNIPGNKAFCNGYHLMYADDLKWKTCTSSLACNTSYAAKGIPYYCREFGQGYKWYSVNDAAPFCDEVVDAENRAYCGGNEFICNNAFKWQQCSPTTACTTTAVALADTYWCRNFGSSGWKWSTCAKCNGIGCSGQNYAPNYPLGTIGLCSNSKYSCTATGWKLG